MEKFWMVVSYLCCFGVWIRFLPYLHLDFSYGRKRLPRQRPLVSIIVPARNEARNIGSFLDALLQLTYQPIEIIVVNDSSDDHTRQIAETYPVKVLTTPQRPSSWVGKSWACHYGFTHSSGEVLLFTDADTIHTPESLNRALAFMEKTGSNFISAPSFHRCERWWETLMGPFFCILHSGASPYDRIDQNNAYALGQYLLIKREHYRQIGGHHAVHDQMAEDAALARLSVINDGKYRMYKGSPLTSVQMYNGVKDFVSGWTRILRLGMRELNARMILFTLIPILAFNFSNFLHLNWMHWTPVLLTLLCFALVQKKIGRFGVAGLLFFPLHLIFFAGLALRALIDQVSQAPFKWKGRVYQPEQTVH